MPAKAIALSTKSQTSEGCVDHAEGLWSPEVSKRVRALEFLDINAGCKRLIHND